VRARLSTIGLVCALAVVVALAVAAIVVVAGRSAARAGDCGLCDPTAVAVVGGEVWVAQRGTVSRFSAAGDLRERAVVRPVGPGDRAIVAIVPRPGGAWALTSGATIGLAPDLAITSHRTRLPRQRIELAGGDRVVVAGRATTIAPDGSDATRSAPLPGAALGASASGEVVWVARAGGRAAPLDARTLAPRGRPIRLPAGADAVASDGAVAWALRRTDGAVWQLDRASGTPVGRLDLGRPADGVVAGGGSAWVALRGAGVARLDAHPPRVAWIRDVPVT
jgi:hypothetical protein